MSWDAYVNFDPCTHCDRSDDSIDVRNVTYNNGKIFSYLGVHPDTLMKLKTHEAVPLLEAALERSHQPKDEQELVKLEPPNKWGGLDDSRDFLKKLLDACRVAPNGSIVFY